MIQITTPAAFTVLAVMAAFIAFAIWAIIDAQGEIDELYREVSDARDEIERHNLPARDVSTGRFVKRG